MKKAVGTALESDFGFKSPSFSVDALGNIIANSISTTEAIGGGDSASTVSNYTVTENELNSGFVFSNVEGSNQTIELARGTTYTFELDLVDLTFAIFESDGSTYYTNLQDDEGNVGVAAQNKKTGLLQVTINADTPDTLIYKDDNLDIQGQFNIVNPTGVFGGLSVSNQTQSTSIGTGALTVAGGASIAKDLYLGGDIVFGGTGDVKFDSSTNLTLGALNKVIIVIDGNKLGEITEDGIETPIANTTIENTSIGTTTPSTASFTSAEVSEAPSSVNNVTNKAYVDSQDVALSIALGS